MKIRKLAAFALSLFAAAAVVSGANGLEPMTAFAAESAAVQQESDLAAVSAKVKAQANGTVTLSWAAVEGADRYATYKIGADGEAELAGYAENGALEDTFTGVAGNVTHKLAVVAEKKLDGTSFTAGKYSEISVSQPLYAPEFSLTPYANSVKITWKEAFGLDAEESFLAWAYASAVEKITAAGRFEYPLPC